MTPLDRLKELLISYPAGEISNDYQKRVITLLVDCWSSIPGSDLHKTEPHKLARAEQLSWDAPVLTVILERHGGVVYGSTLADMHIWKVDLSVPRAEIVHNRARQVSPASAKMDVKQKAQEIAAYIENETDTPYLKWSSDRQAVHVVIGAVIPEEKEQTTKSRRKRFHEALEAILGGRGWSIQRRGSVINFVR